MSLSITRPSTSNVVLHITLGQVLKGALAFKGLMIEWVVIKGYNETVDLWSESRHKVFRKVTENAHAAMLHLYSPNLPDFALRSFIVSSLLFLIVRTNKNNQYIFSDLAEQLQ